MSLLQSDSLLEYVNFLRLDSYRKINETNRSEMGQYLTPTSIAQFMASMLSQRPPALNIVDAGAGVGTLSAACIAEVCQWERKPHSITVTAYEIESVLLDYLHMTLEACASACKLAGINFTYRILQQDFIEAGVIALRDEGTLFSSQHPYFNCSIVNPPYRKLNSKSRARELLRSVGIETSNFYAAFLWLIVKLLEPQGELVAITPRSFCNGPYFRPFRLALFESMNLQRFHLFETRDKAFVESSVLQENIIFQAIKSRDRTTSVLISSSVDPDDQLLTVQEVKRDQLVDPTDPQAFIHIVPDEMSHQIGQQFRSLEASLDDLELSVSTGRVVDFRVKHLLRDQVENEAIPLIYPHNFSSGFVAWPTERNKKPKALASELEVSDLVLPADYYVVVKRFSSKEERRRVVAAVYDPDRIPAERVGFENHVNYFYHQGKSLTRDLAKGLAAFLNSTLVDQYFRQFNGHTQINATDLRNLKYPTKPQLVRIGSRIGDTFPDQAYLDQIVMQELELMSENQDARAYDPVQVKKKIEEARNILRALNLPRAQQNDRSALTLLALLNMKANSPWSEASASLLGITEMMDYFRVHFGVTYAPNTRETVRRYTVHQFVQAGLVLANPDNPARPINSPDNRYQIEPKTLSLIKTYGTDEWTAELEAYLETVETLQRLQAHEREMSLIHVKLPSGDEIVLTAGGQNLLIKQVIEEFCPRFTPGGVVVYVGDAKQIKRS